MKRLFLTLFWGACSAFAYAEVTFSDLDLTSESTLVFAGKNTNQTGESYRTWFKADLDKASMESLTFYPESASWLSKPGQLHIQNRFGVFRLSADGSAMKIVSPEAFEKKSFIGEGKLLPFLVSPDGANILFFQKTSAIGGDLTLFEVATGKKTTVAISLLLSFRAIPAVWSPDGQFFLYEKNGELYYFSIKQLKEDRVPEETLRRMGKGLISSVSWGASGELYYVQDQVLYRILPEEFFTRSIYGGRFQTWGIVGKLPFAYKPAEDQFWLAGDRRYVLFNLGGRTLFLYPLEYLDFYQTAKLQALSYVPLPQNLEIRRVLWGTDGKISLLTRSLSKGKEVSQVLRLSGQTSEFLNIGNDTILDMAFSPDESMILLTKTNGLSVRDAQTFTEKAQFPMDSTVAGFWKDQQTVILCAKSATVTFSLTNAASKLLLLGDLDQVGIGDTGTLVARQGKSWFTYQGQGIWRPSNVDFKLNPPQSSTSLYRAFAEDLESGPYKNWVLVRDLKALTTKPLFPRPSGSYEPFPDSDEALKSAAVFTHGSRLRVREVSLVVDAIDTSDGLPLLLRTLREWGFQTTFFVGGDFLRRNPQAAQELSASPHEVGNMFHINFDLNDPRFVIDSDFVRQGLARQEDDWYRVTGKELSLLWHAPGWVVSDTLLKGAGAANYQTVGRDVLADTPVSTSVNSAAYILDLLNNKKPGSILPLTLGMKDSKTGESFFSRLDLLLNALVESGYRVVPVSVLMDRTRK